MKLIRSLILAITLPTLKLHAQASWTYNLYFGLYNNKGNQINPQDITDGHIKIYTYDIGAHSESKLTFDPSRSAFRLSQHTITSYSVLVFVTHTDTTTLEFQTTNLWLDKVTMNGHNYQYFVYKNPKLFECSNSQTNYKFCRNIGNEKKYIKEEHLHEVRFDNLKELKLTDL